jgi:hypothetical protein
MGQKSILYFESFFNENLLFLLFRMEQALGTTIPYWDSSLDFEMPDPVNSILFTARYFGNGFGFVTAGPFANLPGRPIIRNIGSDGTLISKQAIASVLSRTRHAEIVEPSSGNSVQYSLEAHHNGPHVWVDGTLGALASAAYDPIFFCHHAFIDYVWELFRRRIPNAQRDYPPTNVPGHEPVNFMDFGQFPFAPRIRNAAGYGNRYARLRMYAPAPSCPLCANSQDLICNNARGVCVSREAPPQARMRAPAATVRAVTTGAMGGASATTQVVAAANAVEADTPQRARNAVAQTGPLAVGQRFVSPFRDGRTRGDSLPNGPADPSLTRGKRSVKGIQFADKRITASDSPDAVSNRRVKETPYQNTFLLNGQSDIRLWAFMPVKVVYLRPPGEDFGSRIIEHGQIINNTDMYDPDIYKSLQGITNDNKPATYNRCSPSKPSPDRVFVQSDGINYSGRYKDFAKIDLRQPISSSFTYIAIRKPTNESSVKAMITAYDTCGRVCRAKCLVVGSEPPVYKSCAGSIKADTRLPLMYGRTYGEAIKGLWRIWETTIQGTQGDHIPLMFLCDHDTSTPWFKSRI